MGRGITSVLVVNSDPGMRDYLCEQLYTMEIHPSPADSLRGALELISRTDLDAIICDEILNDGHGIELIERLKRCGSKIPTAILLSGNPTLSEISALARGAEMVFQKPFGLQDLVDGVRTLTGLKCPNEEPANGQTGWSSRDNTQNSPRMA